MFYTREEIVGFLQSNNITSTKDFRIKNSAMYLWYTRHSEEIGDLGLTRIKKANNTLTLDLCFSAAKKYQYRSDFQKQDKGAYLKLYRENKLDEACAHMSKKPSLQPSKYGKPVHNRKDLTGQKFGKWSVISIANYRADNFNGLFFNCVCECGNEVMVKGQNLANGSSTKCIKCSNQVSQPSIDIFEYVKSLGFSDAVLSDRSKGFEIDIYIPSKNLAIEYDGLIWHSSKFRTTEGLEKDRYRKYISAKLTCLRIFEDEWLNKPEIVKSMIRSRLGILPDESTINYEIRFIDAPAKYKDFFDSNHLDGYGRASFGFGAFIGDKLISCVTFRPYMQGVYKGQLELARFCSDKELNCYGLFGKLMKTAKRYIKEKNLSTHILSASDNRISTGNVYKNNGFTFINGSDKRLNYYYYIHSKGVRVHRSTCKRLNPPQISIEQFTQYPTESAQVESGLMALVKFGKSESLYKVWGWGNKLWILTL